MTHRGSKQASVAPEPARAARIARHKPEGNAYPLDVARETGRWMRIMRTVSQPWRHSIYDDPNDTERDSFDAGGSDARDDSHMGAQAGYSRAHLRRVVARKQEILGRGLIDRGQWLPHRKGKHAQLEQTVESYSPQRAAWIHGINWYWCRKDRSRTRL